MAGAVALPAQVCYALWVEEVAAIDQDGSGHKVLQLVYVSIAELLPFGDQYQGVYVLRFPRRCPTDYTHTIALLGKPYLGP